MVRSLALLAGASFLCLSMAAVSTATSINYGNFIGDNVGYLGVTEASNSGDALPLFGAPSISGDSLDFNPVQFNANSSDGGTDVTDGQLLFDVAAKVDKNISSILISESGDTTLSGFGTDATFTKVTASIFVDINEVEGVAVNPVKFSTSMTFTPSGGDFALGTDGGGGPSFDAIWSGSSFLDLDAELANAGISGSATRVSVNLDNTLTAISEEGTFALIAKKNFGGLSVTVNGPNPGGIPEPGTAAIAGLALLSIVLGCRVHWQK